MIPNVARPVLVIGIFLMLILLSPTAYDVKGQQSPSINNVRWYPNPPTPNDHVSIRANVTSSVGIRNVTIYFRLGAIGLSLKSESDYNKSSMQGPILGDNRNGVWTYSFTPQRNGTVIYFVIEAFDTDGLASAYPDNFPFNQPQSMLIESPSKPYLSGIFISINTLTLSDVLQQANVTISMGGYFPSVPEPYFISADVISNGPYRYRWLPFLILDETDSRFFYHTESSSIIDLSGSTSQVPYDTYTLSLNITIPYRFDNLTYALSQSGIYVSSAYDIYNSWHVPQPTTVAYTIGNQTRLRIDTTLSRRIPTFYPPLVLMMIALAVLGLIPLVSINYPDKRYDLFLNVIILASSAELSQSLYPATGFLGDNIFLISFATILAAAVLMMAASSLPEDLRMKKFHGVELEIYTTILIIALASIVVSSTNFPIIAKLLTPPLGGSGVILLAIYRSEKRMKNEIRRDARKLTRRVKTLFDKLTVY